MAYRALTDNEIFILENNNCWAEDWSKIEVDEDGFQPKFLHRVIFYGDIRLGAFEKNVEVSKGFFKHSGINDATLRNVTVGNNCLIEKIGNYIHNYTIGDDCLIANVSVMETTEGATYGQGNVISVLNEAGDGNIIMFPELSSQFAAFMVKYFKDKDLKNALRRLVSEEIACLTPSVSTIGNNVKIVNSKEITNTIIHNDCEISGASRLCDCTILSSEHANVYIGTGVICENSIISEGSSIINSAKIQDCFIGETCYIANGFTASQSVFFANSYMANGEACAAFCGPFTVSHHKSTLLIGGMYSFYNAGSATNFSNHAYKMGPLHYGTLERGCKTASGSHVVMPATIGSFSVCFGKITNHPDTEALPFSYIIAYNEELCIVPGRNIATVGLYRDIRKWPKRDLRPQSSQKSIINFEWLSPFTASEIVRGRNTLKALKKASGATSDCYIYNGYTIKASSLDKGIQLYEVAIHIYMGEMLKKAKHLGILDKPLEQDSLNLWSDLGGLLLPDYEEQRILEDIKSGGLETIEDVNDRFKEINSNYYNYAWDWTRFLIDHYYGSKDITETIEAQIVSDYNDALKTWISEIRKDAEKEYSMGDVDKEVLEDFLEKLEQENYNSIIN
ncbi:DUF4954 family protein [Prevotella intermedia]|uniref:DUF4954 domain-containing protein n=1 Tax=Prevotella intermedia TaxID=28131 RepID=A0A2G8IBG0_PREIN|nr:DUF4954 family protein [Prevotella intermedia]PIK20863.1 DUF4954 domain-containing protein [Prevotella intermedia]